MKKALTILLIQAFFAYIYCNQTLNVMQDTEEIWKDVPGYKGRYKVSDLGRFMGQKGTILKQQNQYAGYLIISLEGRKKKTTRSCHKIVAVTFVDNPHRKTQINHINGIKTDNRAVNLEWVTPKENTHHAMRTGLRDGVVSRGEKSHFAKLTEKDVRAIRDHLQYSMSAVAIADEFFVTKQSIRNVIRRKTWFHI